ncbi:hypothetical protein PG984_011403 [Apiospora sp. TS-2023a]
MAGSSNMRDVVAHVGVRLINLMTRGVNYTAFEYDTRYEAEFSLKPIGRSPDDPDDKSWYHLRSAYHHDPLFQRQMWALWNAFYDEKWHGRLSVNRAAYSSLKKLIFYDGAGMPYSYWALDPYKESDPTIEEHPFTSPRGRATLPDDITVLCVKDDRDWLMPQPPRDWFHNSSPLGTLFCGVKNLGMQLPVYPRDIEGKPLGKDGKPLPTDEEELKKVALGRRDALVRYMPCLDKTCRCWESSVRHWLPCPQALLDFSSFCHSVNRVCLLVDVFKWSPDGKYNGPWWKPIELARSQRRESTMARNRDSKYYEVDISLARALHLQSIVDFKEDWDRITGDRVHKIDMCIMMNV